MELRPFDVNVMLLVPGLVRSRIAENAAPQQVNIPADSPYAPYADKIAARGQPSPDVCMDTAAFAQEVVKQAMKKSPPRLFRLGGYASAAGVMKCLPRGMLLSMSTPSAQ
jgi:1-acylglycerone phosphate reductase